MTGTKTIDTKEAARRIGVSSETVRRWAQEGLLPGAKKSFPYWSNSKWELPEDLVDQIVAGEFQLAPKK